MPTLAIYNAQSAVLTALAVFALEEILGSSQAEENVLTAIATELSELAALPFDADAYSIRNDALQRLQGQITALTHRSALEDLALQGVRITLGPAQFDFFGKQLFLSP